MKLVVARAMQRNGFWDAVAYPQGKQRKSIWEAVHTEKGLK